MSAWRDTRNAWTASRAIGVTALVLAFVFALGAAYPLTLAVTLAIGVCAVVVALTLPRQTAAFEFLTSFIVPLFGLLLVIAPAVTVYETVGFSFELVPVLRAATLGLATAVAAAFVFPIAAGGFRPILPRLTLGHSGQLLVPLGSAGLLIYGINQLRIIDRAPPPLEIYALLVAQPAQRSAATALVVTPVLVAIVLILIGVLFSRPLVYKLLYPEEREGELLQLFSWVCYRLAVAVVVVGWLLAFLIATGNTSQVSYPGPVWTLLDLAGAGASNITFARLVVNTLIVYALGALLASPLYLVQWAERKNALWLIRHFFSGALAIIVGLSMAYFVRQAIRGSEDAIETMDSIGDPAWQLFNQLPVWFTMLPLVGTAVIFIGSILYVVLFYRDDSSYPMFIAYRNVGFGALVFAIVLASAGSTPTVVGLFAAAAAVVAWDSLEFSYTLRAELPELQGVAANEFVHAVGIVGVAVGAVVLGVGADRLFFALVTPRQGTALAAFAVLVGAVLLVFALRE